MNTQKRTEYITKIKNCISEFDKDNCGLDFFVHEMDCGECEHRYHYVDRKGLSVDIDSTHTKFTPYECLCDIELQDIIINLENKYGKVKNSLNTAERTELILKIKYYVHCHGGVLNFHGYEIKLWDLTSLQGICDKDIKQLCDDLEEEFGGIK